MDSLDPLFDPRSVAIIGASSDANKVGGRPLAFLLRAGYRGAIYPVNPRADSVQGVAAYRSLADVGRPVEHAIVAVPAADVLGAARQCMALGVRALQIFSAGFGEGSATEADRTALARDAREAGMRILGPNSLGLFRTSSGFFGTFATALDGAWPRAGHVGVATQSGAFGSYFFGMAQQRGLAFSLFVATGNESDVDVADCISFMARDPDTKIIVTAMEGCKDGRKLVAALLEANAAGKPVLAMKVGVSKAGARAAATHTGALSGEDRVFDAALRSCGAFRCQSLQALVDAACLASIGPLPGGRDMLIVTTSGGIGVLSADAAEEASIALPPVSGKALAKMREIALLADGHNPVDTSAGILADLSAYARIAACALDDRPFDIVVCYLAHIARNPSHWSQLREPLYRLRASHPTRTFVAVLLASPEVTADLEAHGFSVFDDPTRAVRAVAACLAPPASRPVDESAVDESGRLLEGSTATESGAKVALAAHGIRFPEERVVGDAEAAVAAASAIGYPVVLKIVSPDIAHKTEVGGVQVGIADAAALRSAVPAMLDRVKGLRSDARIDGFLVARQLDGGVELLVGTQRDPIFGPVVTVGAGGILAELMQDVEVRLAPVDAATAKAMLLATRAGRLCLGFRGSAPGDIEDIARQIALLSEVAWANRSSVAGIDINPMLALPQGAFALDALITLEARPT